jgi:hypothetical protein
MPLWDKKSEELAKGLANAQAEAVYRDAITSGGIRSGGLSIGPSSVDIARRISGMYPSRNLGDMSVPENRKSMIAMRLRLEDGMKWPFDFLETHWHDDTVYVFLVANGKPVMLQDDAGLFPSDTLITQLRLIHG